MARTDIAKLFQNGSSQAVRLPRDFRFTGDRVRIRRIAEGVLLQPMIEDPKEWFQTLDEISSEPFQMVRRQPSTPKRTIFS
jgi:antitoxin VapB